MGNIITFFSYKGGTGRTMALANIAYILSEWGFRVLVVDWDLEAPGIEYYFSSLIDPSDVSKRQGVVDLLVTASKLKRSENTWRDFLIKIRSSLPSGGELWLIPAGRRDKEYFRQLREFDVSDFYKNKLGETTIDQLRKEWTDEYDFILVDSRTGVTDFGGICTVQLPDILLTFCTSIKQSIEGTKSIVENIYKSRESLTADRNYLPIVPILSRFDAKEEREISEQWRNEFTDVFSDNLNALLPFISLDDENKTEDVIKTTKNRSNFISLTTIPYVPYYSFGEKLVALETNSKTPGDLLYTYETICAIIAHKLLDIDLLLENRDQYLSTAKKAKVYISYAEEDSELAKFLAKKLIREDFSLAYFEYANNLGNPIIETQRQILEAEIILVILSDNYLQSAWCRAELDIATQLFLERDIKSEKKQIQIQILKVEDIDNDVFSLSKIYDWVDVSGPQRSKKIEQFINSLAKRETKKVTEFTQRISQDVEWMPFVNRESERHFIVTNLENPSGNHFYAITAPPGFGKTRLALQVATELLTKNNHWIIRTIDLSSVQKAKMSLVSLLRSLKFDVPIFAKENINKFANIISSQVKDSGQLWLLIIDGAEELDNIIAKQLRELFSLVVKKINAIPSVRFAVIIASRTELMPFKGVIPKPAFQTLVLTSFTQKVISEMLRAINSETSIYLEYSDIGNHLLKVTEGLPELIARYLSWMRDKRHFAFIPENIDNENNYNSIVANYIENTLLSADILLPHNVGIGKQEGLRKVWAKFILDTTSFRIFTRTHIRFINTEEVTRNLISFQPDASDLLDTFGKISLVIPTQTMWYQIAPAIRRLLFHYRYRSEDEKIEVHKRNERLYESWWKKLSGTDLLRFLLEQFWHYVEQIRISNSKGKKSKSRNIVDRFQKLCKELKPTDISYFDQLVGLGNLIAGDEELTTSLESIEQGLSERIYAIVEKLKESQNES